MKWHLLAHYRSSLWCQWEKITWCYCMKIHSWVLQTVWNFDRNKGEWQIVCTRNNVQTPRIPHEQHAQNQHTLHHLPAQPQWLWIHCRSPQSIGWSRSPPWQCRGMVNVFPRCMPMGPQWLHLHHGTTRIPWTAHQGPQRGMPLVLQDKIWHMEIHPTIQKTNLPGMAVILNDGHGHQSCEGQNLS